MHNHKDWELSLNDISKIEGHTSLNIKARDGKVVECELKISENKRFFTTAVLGQPYSFVPATMSRICGTCSSAHTLCAIEAVEKALKIELSKQTMQLRTLLMNAGHLRDHAMHLYFFCLPDLLHKDSALDFTGKQKDYIHDGLHIKEAGNFLSTIIGGRAIHPPNAVIGGFTKFPKPEEMQEAITNLEDCRPRILKIIDVFYNDKTEFSRKTNYVALISKDYNYLKGHIKTAYGTIIEEENYGEHLHRVVLPYSTATAFEWESKDYMVGALARLNLNKESLNPRTKKDAAKFLKVFPADCIFKNNLAQAIEMLQEVDNSIDILKELKDNMQNEPVLKIAPQKGIGIGVVEAPRGTLYYHLELDEKGIVTFADLCIPTQQNIIHLQKDIAKYVEHLLLHKKAKEEISFEVEKMIRAYDPCMSCATHFLRINWV